MSVSRWLNGRAGNFKFRDPGFKSRLCSLRTQKYITFQLFLLIILTQVNGGNIIKDSKLIDLKSVSRHEDKRATSLNQIKNINTCWNCGEGTLKNV